MCGLRIGEALALTYADITSQGKVRVSKTLTSKRKVETTKTGNSRELQLPERLSYLFELRGPEKAIINLKGEYMHYNTIVRPFRSLQLQVIGKYYEPHFFRHASSRRWFKSGLKDSEISLRLGHDSVQTTLEYYGRYRRFNDQIEDI